MKKMKSIIRFLFILIITSSYCCAQKDSIKPIKRNSDYKFGVFAGLTINTTKNLNTTYNPLLNTGSNPLVDYKEKIFLNSFSNNFLIPYIGFELKQNKQFVHSYSVSYLQKKLPMNAVQVYASTRKERAVFHEYNFYYFFLAKKTEKILPFIGATISVAHKKIDDNVSSITNSTFEYDIFDKSNLILLQVPIGVRFSKNHFFAQLNTTMTIASYSLGSQNFNASTEIVFQNQINKYSKFLFIDQLIKEKYFFQNVFEINLGYKF